MGKKWKNSYRKLVGSPDESHIQTHRNLTEKFTDVFLDQKRVNVCEHTVKTAPCDSFGKVPPEWVRDRKNKKWR